jgi:hypothetical protein
MAPLSAVPDPPESARHRGRPPLTPAERAAHREARNAAKRRARREASRALEVITAQAAAPISPVPAAPAPAPPHVYFALGQRARALLGFAVGAFVPLASYTVVHVEVNTRPLMWFLVAGGLLYSSISVYTWAVKIFRWRLRALGFVVLLESTLTFCGILWLGLAGLAILMLLNALNAAVALQQSEAIEAPPAEVEPCYSPDSGLNLASAKRR